MSRVPSRFSIEVEKELVECSANRIMVVDDEQMLRTMFVKALKQEFPYLTIDEAEDGRMAVEMFRQGTRALSLWMCPCRQ